MLENDEHKEKKNFTESEIEVLQAEVEVRAGTLFESLSSGLSHKQNCGMAVYTEKNDSLNLLNFFKVSGCNQFILATFK